VRRLVNLLVVATVVVAVLLLVQRGGKLGTELCGEACVTSLEEGP